MKADRRSLAVLALAVVLGGGGGLALKLLRRAPSAPQPPAKAALAPPDGASPKGVSRRAAEPDADEDEDRLWRAPDPDDVGFGDFVAMLGLAAKAPDAPEGAKVFAAVFTRDTETRAVAEEFRKAEERGEEPSAAEFLARLDKLPQFHKAMSAFAFQNGSSTAVLALFKRRELRVLAAWAAGKTAKPDERIVAAILRGEPLTAGVWRGATVYLAAAAAAAARARASAAASAAPSAAPPQAPAAKETALPGAHDTTWDEKWRDQNPEAHDANSKLKERFRRLLELYPWLAPLGYARLHLIEDTAPKFGLWGACFSLGFYRDCSSACRNDPAGKCLVDKDPWRACLDWKNEKDCIAPCKSQAPCVVPAPVLTTYCEHRWSRCCSTTGGCHDCAPCKSQYHDHSFCSAGGGPAAAGPTAAAPSPSPSFYPSCSDLGSCRCCYKADGHFGHDEPAGCNHSFVCPECGPRGCL